MSRTPLFAMTSDWHCQVGAWKRANTPRGDAFHSLRQIVKHCCDHRLDLLGAGDLIDELKPETSVLDRLFEECSILARNDRRFIFTQGQHEKAYPPYLSLHPYPQHGHRKLLTLRGVTIYGMDHVAADRLETEVAEIPANADILMCHQVWADFMGVGAEGHLGMLLKAGGPNIILTGDYHQHGVLEIDGSKIYSPGSTCLQDIAEPREKSFFVFYDDFSVDSVPLLTRKVVDSTIDTPERLELFLERLPGLLEPGDRLPPELQKNIIYLTVDMDVPEAYSRITRAIGDKAFLFLKAATARARETDLAEDDVQREIPRGMEGCLSLVTAPQGAVYNSVLRLLRAPDKKHELSQMRDEFGS